MVGTSGSGKTTTARALAAGLGLRHVELDEIFHQPGWTPLPDDEFRRRVAEALPPDGHWVTDGNYATVADIVAEGADAIVWLDLPRSLTMRRLARRTLRRSFTREELWNGNREPLGNFTRWDPEKNILRWAWTNHQKYVDRYDEWSKTGRWADIAVHRLRSPAEVDALLRAL